MILKLQSSLGQLDVASSEYALKFVDLCLATARTVQASDLHLQPTEQGLDVRLRVDGVLQEVGVFARGNTTDVVSRLKVLAQLLTYRVDVPQEGRIAGKQGAADVRVCTFPTVFGERAVVRFFSHEQRYLYPPDLGLSTELTERYCQWLREANGLLIVTGPAGSGKSTTAYAGLRYITQIGKGERSIVTLEDPVEVVVPGIAQSQVNVTAGFTIATGLRSLLRQDPEVILVGEIRDVETSELAFQAALTGHLILSTFHAGNTAEGVGRLLDMGIEPYVVRSALKGMLSQRLLRRLCVCGRPSSVVDDGLGLAIACHRVPVGCEVCGQSGYRGRAVAAEWLPALEGDLGRAVLERRDARYLFEVAQQHGMISLEQAGLQLVSDGIVAPLEFRRVFGTQRVLREKMG